MLGTIFGVATSLGIGVVSLNVGLNVVFGIPQGLAAQSALIILAVAIATLSAVSGVDKGIKRISQLNVLLAILLAVFVLVTGRTAYLLNALVLNIGDYFRLLPDMTMQTFAFEDTGDWMSFWTLFFWAWWIAWSAFVGLFLARISRGRTIKQFVAGTMIIPFSYIVMWISIFGNAALDEIRRGNASFTKIASEATDPSNGLWALLQRVPLLPRHRHPGHRRRAAVLRHVGRLRCPGDGEPVLPVAHRQPRRSRRLCASSGLLRPVH